MILTVTMNPSIDISYPLAHLAIDTTNRPKTTTKTAGGKGLNVTRVIHLLKHPVVATGIVGGNFGRFIEEQLDADGIAHHFTHIDQETRNSIAILHDGGQQTEVLEAGPTINAAEQADFIAAFDQLLAGCDLVTMSGSLPQGLTPDFYATLIAHAANAGKKVLLDSSGASLQAALQADVKPWLIKPNETELAGLLGEPVDKTDLVRLQKQLTQPVLAAVEWIVVSLGKDGAFVRHQAQFYHVTIPTIQVVNPVGSGDATLAGLAMALAAHQDDTAVLKTAMTTGMLNTMQARTGWVDAAQFDPYFSQVHVATVKRGSAYVND